MVLTEEQQAQIAQKETLLAEKEQLVIKRKALAEELAYAESDMEEGLIQEERDALATRIKALASKLREIEEWETLA